MKSQLNATVSFGLVTIPVGIAGATTEKELVKFKRLDVVDEKPIKTVTINHEGTVLEPGETIRGWEYAKDQFVTVTDEEVEAVKKARSPVIEVDRFVPWAASGNYLAKKNYYLLPNDVFPEGYALLHTALLECEADAFGKCVLWGKEAPFLLGPTYDGLVLRLLHNRSELVEPNFDAPMLDVKDAKTAKLLKAATQLVKSSLGNLDVNDLAVESEALLRKLVEAKAKGKAAKLPKEGKAKAPTQDLMAALKETLEKGLVRA